jgi:APA family basic amino acid/polyamine antiporter
MKTSRKINLKVTGYPVVQVIIILFSLTLIINTITSQPKQSLTGMGLMLSGVLFYYYFKRKKFN